MSNPPDENPPFAAFSKWIFTCVSVAGLISLLISGFLYRENLTLFYSFLSVLTVGLILVTPRLLRDRGVANRLARAGTLLVLVALSLGYMGWSVVEAATGGVTKMDGNVNVLITTLRDTEGGGDGAYVSGIVEESLMELEAARPGVQVERTDSVVGNGREALALAAEYGADLVVYGEASKSEGGVRVNPSYAITGSLAGELQPADALGLVGESSLGGALPVDTAIGQAGTLSGRSEVIVVFIEGLVDLLAGDYESSVAAFRRAIDLHEVGTERNAVLHFFLGKALSLSGPNSRDEALGEFDLAQGIDPEYARAYLGIANEWYLVGSNNALPDRDALMQSVELYNEVLTRLGEGENLALEASAHYGLGNAYYAMTAGTGDDFRREAKLEYDKVVDLHASTSCEADEPWWDLTLWGPWKTWFETTSPGHCDTLSDLAKVAAGLPAGLEIVFRENATATVAAGSATPGPAIPTRTPQLTAAPGSRVIVRIEPPVASGTVEGSVDLEMLGLAGAGLGAWTIDVDYDPTIITIECLSDLPTNVCNPAFDENTLRLAGAAASGLAGDVTLATFTFSCVSEGRSEITPRVDILADATPGDPQLIVYEIEEGEVICLP